ncbi:MAG: hypothetical protein IKT46_00520 [Clostridia bacterium]|nr:hypothetical protein [Clostridia bacterium]
MSFKRNEFVLWLKDKGYKSTGTYCSYLRKIQKEFKADIDTAYTSDSCSALLEAIEARLNEGRTPAKRKSARITELLKLKKRKRQALGRMRNSLKKYISFCNDLKNSSLSDDTYDWSNRDTMVGTVRDALQLEFILKYRGYYAPAQFITEDKLPIRYIALHEQGIGSEPGIHRYGEVITVQRVRRSRIPVPMSRPNGDEPYYYFKILRWQELPKPILIRDTHRGVPLFTSKLLLDSCAQSYQLFSVTSDIEYSLMNAINKVFEELAEVGIEDLNCSYPINNNYTLKASQGHLELTDSRGESLERISFGSFSYRPKDGFERFKNKLRQE